MNIASEVAASNEVDQVHCYACWHRKRFAADCVRCGGTGALSIDKHEYAVHEALSDALQGKTLPGWVVPGFYAFAKDSDCYLVRHDRSVVSLSEDAVNAALRMSQPKPSLMDRIVAWVIGASGKAGVECT